MLDLVDPFNEQGDLPLPPHDLEAEAAILACALASPAHRTKVQHLRPDQFWNPANRQSWRAMLELDASQTPVTEITLRAQLLGYTHPRVNADDVIAILNATPFLSDIEAHAEIVITKARLRHTIATLERGITKAHLVNGEANEFLEQLTSEVAFAAKDTAPSKSIFQWESTDEIMGPLPPIAWVCRELCIGPGRPTLLQGYGFSGKTLILQAFALAIATGLPAFGYFRVKQGIVRHIDYEQGKHATKRRYQRMRFAMGITSEQMGGRLRLTCFPSAYLTDPGIEAQLTKECTDTSVCIIDSFRAAIPGQDENESTVRQFLDMLTRVSEATDCSFIVIHHSGKGGKEKDSREKSRGSSSIFDACGTVIDLQAQKPFEPVKVCLVKASASNEGKPPEPFYVAFEDLSDDEGRDMKAGLLVSHRTTEQIEQPAAPADSWKRTLDEVLTCLGANQGRSGSDIARACGKGKGVVLDALKGLRDRGLAESRKLEGRGGGFAWFIASTTESEGQVA